MKKGTIFLSVYSFICMFQQFFGHGKTAEIMRNLAQRLPDQVFKYYGWVLECKLTNLHSLVGAISGITVAFLTSVAITVGLRRQNKDVSALLCFGSYVFVFVAFSALFDPHMLNNYVDPLFILVFAGVLAFSTSFYVETSEKKYKFKNYQLELEYLKLKHASKRDYRQFSGWALIIVFASVYAQLIYGSYIRYPPEILGTPEYSTSLLLYITLAILIVTGYFLGIVSQQSRHLDAILARIEEIDRMASMQKRTKRTRKQKKKH